MQLKELIPGDVLVGFSLGGPVAGGGDDENRLCNSGWKDVSVKVLRRTKIKMWLGFRTIEQESLLDMDFRWLPYVASRINWTLSEGRDVLSGLYSGCLMSRYKDGGLFKIAHIFCDEVVKNDCKTQWGTYKATVTDVIEFKPHEHRDVERGGDRIFGFVTNTAERWAISGKNYDVRIKNPLDEKGWLEKIKRDGLLKGSDVELKAAAKACAANKTCAFSEIYGISLEIRGLKQVTG